jgi:hypothetical protein
MRFDFLAFRLKLMAEELISLKAIPTILEAFLAAFGSLWLLVEIITYFSETSRIPELLSGSWYLFLLAGLLIVVVQHIPTLSYGCKLNNRDTYIELVIGDLFKYEGDLIIGSNTTFDTRISHDLISEKSIQGQFTKKYYGDGSKLDKEIITELQEITPEILSEKRIGNNKKYPIGTVVKLNPEVGRTAYMVAIAHINEYGTARGTIEELMQALPCLWTFISRRGLKGKIVMPIIGSGFARLSVPREKIVHEILKSFVAACSESTFCDRLTIVINPYDIDNNEINMDELEKYLYHTCKYAQFASNSQQTGVPV